MSSKNGDKARYQIARKRRVLQRVKIRALLKAKSEEVAAPKADAKASEHEVLPSDALGPSA